MKQSNNRKFIVIVFLLSIFSFILIENGISQGLNEVPYEPATKIQFVITPSCSYDSSTGFFTYEYRLYSKPSSLQNIWTFEMEADVSCEDLRSPSGWKCIYFKKLPSVSHPILSWGTDGEPSRLRPGNTASGFLFRSLGIPGIVTSYNEGWVQPPWYPEGMAPADNRPKWPEDSVKSKTIGPVSIPPVTFDPLIFVDNIINLKHSAFDLGWIDNQGIMNSLDKKLEHAKAKLQNGQNNTAKNELNALLNELNAQKGKHVNDSAYAVLKANVDYLISKI